MPTFDEITTAFAKEASLGSMFLRALGGTAVGAAVGGGGNALLAKLQGGDPVAAARRGAIGGGAMGGLLGGAHGHMTPGGVSEQFATLATTALVSGAATGFAGHALNAVGSGGGAGAEQTQRELGRYRAQQQIRAEVDTTLAPKHMAAFRQAMQDSVIAQADPTLMQSSFETMKRFAPHLAVDPNAVKSFLRESATWGTGPSYATLKNLADAERAISGAQGAGSF